MNSTISSARLSSQQGQGRRILRRSGQSRAAQQKPIRHIPIIGTITAGIPESREQEAKNRISINEGSVSINPSARTFALKVRDQSMLQQHILKEDTVIFEHGVSPCDGDVVSVLMDNLSVLKSLVVQNGKAFLKDDQSKPVPAQGFVIQGVMIGLIRRR